MAPFRDKNRYRFNVCSSFSECSFRWLCPDCFTTYQKHHCATLTLVRPAQGWIGLYPLSVSCSVVSYSVQLHRLQPPGLICPWDFPGKNTGELPLLTPGDLPDPGIEPESLAPPAGSGGFFTTTHLLGRVIFHSTLPLALNTAFPGFSENMCCTRAFSACILACARGSLWRRR